MNKKPRHGDLIQFRESGNLSVFTIENNYSYFNYITRRLGRVETVRMKHINASKYDILYNVFDIIKEVHK